MKFENIKVGDEVLIPVVIDISYRRSRTFLVKQEVTKTTKTQFSVGKLRLKKDSGRVIGSRYSEYAVFEGDKKHCVDSVYEDNTEECKAFRELIATHRKIIQIKDKITRIELDIDTPIDIIKNVLESLEKSNKALKTAKEISSIGSKN